MKHDILQSGSVARVDDARQGLSEDVLWFDLQLAAEALADEPPRGRQGGRGKERAGLTDDRAVQGTV